jgi:hypothetical protein
MSQWLKHKNQQLGRFLSESTMQTSVQNPILETNFNSSMVLLLHKCTEEMKKIQMSKHYTVPSDCQHWGVKNHSSMTAIISEWRHET